MLASLELAKQVLEKQHTIVLKQQKAVVLLAANAECEKKLLSSMKVRLQSEVDVPPESIWEAELADFDKCNVPLLKAFIHVRKFNTVVVPTAAQWNWPKKEKLENALQGEDCLITRAHDCRSDDIVLEIINPVTIMMPEAAVAPPPTIILTVEQQNPAASTFLDDNSWVLQVSGAFVGDILYGIMKARFASLLNSHLLDRQMHSHECVVFVKWNLSRLAAILILSRQVQDDLATTAKDDTL
jgi:hypothetical protein